MGTQYRCKNPRRTALVRDTKDAADNFILNGIDYLEVLPGQTDLEVHFIHDLSNVPGAQVLGLEHVAIRGGVRVTGVAVTEVEPNGKVLTVTVDRPGDFSTYTLFLRQSPTDPNPPKGFDPKLSEVEFSFKVECPSDFDCKKEEICPPERLEEPQIDYMAKDYESFRRLMLDRLSLIMPDWKERNPADLQVALVELLAYVGDRLSYYQDAVATETYLGTARQRPSVRRHARLLDYPMHDGCNARVWVTIKLKNGSAEGKLLPGPDLESNLPGTLLLTGSSAPAGSLAKDRVQAALNEGAVAFETLHDLPLYRAHNEMKFYTWGDEACCLPKGATRAFLKDDPDNRLLLRRGDVLIFEEKVDPKTGSKDDANPLHRHPVRLTQVRPEASFEEVDGKIEREAGLLLVDELTKQAYVEIEWDPQDALPFPLCLSATTDMEYGEKCLESVSVALGNVVLADHGQTVAAETLPVLEKEMPPKRHRPTLQKGPLTQQGRVKTRKADLPPMDSEAPAKNAFQWEMNHVRPAIRLLEGGSEDRPWLPERDLLSSDRFAQEFVVEIGDDGRTQLRFGDDVLGAQPAEGFAPHAYYRVGNGRVGNVGQGTIVNVVSDLQDLEVRNPLPAQGGNDPEDLEQVRLYAPEAFRRQERAVTAADYAEVTERHPEVQKAAATIRWTGSWYTVFVTIDREGGRAVDAGFEQDIRDFLERYRLAGHDLEVNGPTFVPLDLKLDVCVKPGYYRSEVKKALLEAFSNRELPQGGRGFFHPDNFTFGAPVYLSRIYAAAMQVPGVQWVEVVLFQRFGKAPNKELEDGVLPTGRLEIVRLDNDPNFPENGRLELIMKGGL